MMEVDPVEFGKLIAVVEGQTTEIKTLAKETKNHRETVDKRLNEGSTYFVKIKGRIKVLSIAVVGIALIILPIVLNEQYVSLIGKLFGFSAK